MCNSIVYVQTGKRPAKLISDVMYEYRNFKDGNPSNITNMLAWVDLVDKVLERVEKESPSKRKAVEEFFSMNKYNGRIIRNRAEFAGIAAGYSAQSVHTIIAEVQINVYINAVIQGLIAIPFDEEDNEFIEYRRERKCTA